MAVPSVTTDACSELSPTYMIGNGEITNTGGATVTRRGFCFISGTESWVSPTGNSDPNSVWTNETNTYDDDTGTFAHTTSTGSSNCIILTRSAILTDRVRIYAYDSTISPPATGTPNLVIEVYYGGSFHQIFSGSITKETWVEKAIGSVESVTQAKIYWNSIQGDHARLVEFDFNDSVSTDDDVVYVDGDFAAESYAYNIGRDEYGEGELTPETLYTVRAYAVNSEGTGYGDTVTGTTTAVEAPTVDTTDCTGINVTTMQGNADITYYGGAAVTRRGFLYAEGLHDALELDE